MSNILETLPTTETIARIQERFVLLDTRFDSMLVSMQADSALQIQNATDAFQVPLNQGQVELYLEQIGNMQFNHWVGLIGVASLLLVIILVALGWGEYKTNISRKTVTLLSKQTEKQLNELDNKFNAKVLELQKSQKIAEKKQIVRIEHEALRVYVHSIAMQILSYRTQGELILAIQYCGLTLHFIGTFKNPAVYFTQDILGDLKKLLDQEMILPSDVNSQISVELNEVEKREPKVIAEIEEIRASLAKKKLSKTKED